MAQRSPDAPFGRSIQRAEEASRQRPGLTGRAAPALFAAVVRPLQAFVQLEASSGILLLASALAALLWANLHPESYRAVFELPLYLGAGSAPSSFALRDLVNDGLMSVFFFVVGMEIKRELVSGELDTLSKASLPAIAAAGGMVIPALIYSAINKGGPGASGWGIPVATDIAFCIGILTLLKSRVPHALIVFVTALAIFDDLGGILVIALFYGSGLHLEWLAAALGVSSVLFLMNRLHTSSMLAYSAGGAVLWYTVHHGGIHATIAGVVLGMMIPARPLRASKVVLRELSEHLTKIEQKEEDEELGAAQILAIEERLESVESPLERFVHALHPFVAYIVMPVFALANAGVSLRGFGVETLLAPVAFGSAMGLFIGKQVGIFAATMAAVKLGVAQIPGGASAVKLYGVSVIAGIGFTVSLFISALAFPASPELLDAAKIGVLLGSLAAGVAGFVILRLTRPS